MYETNKPAFNYQHGTNNAMPATAVANTIRVPEIQAELLELTSQLEVLGEAAINVRSRIAPILRQEPSGDSQKDPQITYGTPIAAQLAELAERVRSIKSVLHDILNRCEL